MMRKILNSKWLTIPLLLILIGLVVILMKRQPSVTTLKEDQKSINDRLAQLQQQYDQLETQKSYLQSDAFLEHEARTKLNYKKPDEEVVYIYHPSQNLQPAATPLVKPAKNWQKWLEYVISRD